MPADEKVRAQREIRIQAIFHLLHSQFQRIVKIYHFGGNLRRFSLCVIKVSHEYALGDTFSVKSCK